MSIRTERIGEQIRDTLSQLLRDDVSDPRVGMVSITRVEVAPDLSSAVVHWSPLGDSGDGAGDEAAERGAEGLSSAAGFLRRRLAAALALRRTPELIFRYDPSIARGAEMLALLRDLEREREARAAAGGAEEGRESDGEEA